MSVSLNATNVRREKMIMCGVQQDSCSLDLNVEAADQTPPPPTPSPPQLRQKRNPTWRCSGSGPSCVLLCVHAS